MGEEPGIMVLLAIIGGSVLATLFLSEIERGITYGVNEDGESTIDLGGRLVASIFFPIVTQIGIIIFLYNHIREQRTNKNTEKIKFEMEDSEKQQKREKLKREEEKLKRQREKKVDRDELDKKINDLKRRLNIKVQAEQEKPGSESSSERAISSENDSSKEKASEKIDLEELDKKIKDLRSRLK